MPEYKDMIKKAYDKGTYDRNAYIFSLITQRCMHPLMHIFKDLDQIGQLVKEEIGYVPCFIRFPGGSSNTISCKVTQRNYDNAYAGGSGKRDINIMTGMEVRETGP